MHCPQCSSSLAPTVYEGVPIHTCEACGGEFIGGEELARIVQTRQVQLGEHLKIEMAAHRPHFGGADTEPHRELLCPACEGSMGLVNYGGDSGVFIDRCGVCGGVWLDHDELEKVQVVMERWADDAPAQLRAITGELERARLAAARSTSNSFSGSRFAFINAIVNRFLDAA
jgi:Zn-finger nucleic acid-binding protein